MGNNHAKFFSKEKPILLIIGHNGVRKSSKIHVFYISLIFNKNMKILKIVINFTFLQFEKIRFISIIKI